MAKAYLVCHSNKFIKDHYLIPIQNDLLEDDVEGAPETYIKPAKENYFLNFDKYICHHDYKHNAHGRVFQKSFSYYFEPLNFYTYNNPSNALTLIQTKTDVALDFISKLSQTGEYNVEPVVVDFKSMIPHIDEVAGAWIADLKRAHLKTAGFFGPHVNKSEEYKRAAEEGNVSSISIKFTSNSKEYTVLISGKGSIVLYDSFNTIEEELDLILQIYEQLIKPHVFI